MLSVFERGYALDEQARGGGVRITMAVPKSRSKSVKGPTSRKIDKACGKVSKNGQQSKTNGIDGKPRGGKIRKKREETQGEPSAGRIGSTVEAPGKDGTDTTQGDSTRYVVVTYSFVQFSRARSLCVAGR